MRTLLLVFMLLISTFTQAQHNFLGKSRIDIVGYYTLDHQFNVKTKRVSDSRIVLTAKGEAQYPYYTFEMDAHIDECISVGIVSKNPEVLLHYQDMLSFLGELIEVDEATQTEIFRVETPNGTFKYRISTPYKNSEQYVSRRNIFYILLSKDDRRLHASK